MNKKITDKKLDTMLKNYCSRKSQVAFDVSLEHKRIYEKNRRVISVVACALALVLVFGFVIFQPLQTQRKAFVVPKGFSISASAAQREPVMLKNVEVELYPKEEIGIGGDITLKGGMVSLEPVWFNMNGEDVETFDYKCENGILYYVIPELKEEMHNGDNSITQDDYFKKGKVLEQIPYNSEDPKYIFVSWHSYKLDEEAAEFFKDDLSEIADEDLRNYRTEHLKTNEDFSYYFGDTITVTAHYKDGTTETAVIEITVDTREDGDTIYGDYVLKYK